MVTLAASAILPCLVLWTGWHASCHCARISTGHPRECHVAALLLPFDPPHPARWDVRAFGAGYRRGRQRGQGATSDYIPRQHLVHSATGPRPRLFLHQHHRSRPDSWIQLSTGTRPVSSHRGHEPSACPQPFLNGWVTCHVAGPERVCYPHRRRCPPRRPPWRRGGSCRQPAWTQVTLFETGVVVQRGGHRWHNCQAPVRAWAQLAPSPLTSPCPPPPTLVPFCAGQGTACHAA